MLKYITLLQRLWKKKVPESSGKKSEKIFGGLNKMNCLRGFRRTQTVYLEVKLNLEIGH